MRLDNNQQTFLALLRAGLWGKEVNCSDIMITDYKAIYQLAYEQSVIGLVAAGLEYSGSNKDSEENSLVFTDAAQKIEDRNLAMNYFVGILFEELYKADIHAILVKGQGVAQCYDRPLLRSSGDVDLLIDYPHYEESREFLLQLADSADVEISAMAHQAVFWGPWEVELHGSLRGLWSDKVDKTLDALQKDCFDRKQFRIWDNSGTRICLPGIEYDIIFVFTHILQHFFRGGIGLRQFCDLSRLLWKYQNDFDRDVLINRLRSMGLLTEWKVFAALCVFFLGMPEESMPLYSPSDIWRNKAKRLLILLLGKKLKGFAQNSETCSGNKRKLVSFKQHTTDMIQQFSIFPVDSVLVWLRMIRNGMTGVLTAG